MLACSSQPYGHHALLNWHLGQNPIHGASFGDVWSSTSASLRCSCSYFESTVEQGHAHHTQCQPSGLARDTPMAHQNSHRLSGMLASWPCAPSIQDPSRTDADVNYQASQVDTDTGLLERALSSSTASGSSEADILAPSFAAFEAPTAVLTALSNAASSTPDSQSWCSTPSLAPDLEQLLTSLTQDASTSPSSDGSAVGKVVETLSHPQLASPPQPNDGNMSCNASTHAEETGSNKQAGADAPLRKRRRKRYDQVLRIFACPFPGCPKSYGKLQHLNTHLDHMKHGDKRCLQQYRNGSRSLSRAQHSSWQP